MPKLTKKELNRRAQTLAKLYIKHKGNQSRIAKALGITRAAVNQRLSNKVGETAQQTLENDLKRAAKKLNLNIDWYLRRLKEGATKPQVHNFKKTKKTPDYTVRHKYLVTLGEVLKYIRGQSAEGGQKVQVFVGSEVSQFVKATTTKQVGSDAGPD